VLTFH